MVRAIYFDVGGTLSHASTDKAHPHQSFKTILAGLLNCDLNDFTAELKNFLWTSRESKAAIVHKLCQHFGVHNRHSILSDLEKHDFSVKLYDGVYPCLKTLASSYYLGILSNTSVWTALDHNDLGLSEYIGHSILSCRVGVAKPSPEIFRIARKWVGLPPDNIIYVGDTWDIDILPALKCGWQAIYVNPNNHPVDSNILSIHGLDELPALIRRLSGRQ
jgi:HAD superfamily hydrolase (TIGR01549 family)